MTFEEANHIVRRSLVEDIDEPLEAFGIVEFKNICHKCRNVQECYAIDRVCSVVKCNYYEEVKE